MTKLDKPVHREVTLNGEEYITSLDPDGMNGGTPEFTLRKKRHRWVYRQKMASLIGELDSAPEPEFKPDTVTIAPKGAKRITHAKVMATDPAWTASEIKAKLAVSDMDYKLKVEVLKAIDDLTAIEDELEPRTLNL
tara:strand:- start:12 stop:419 length:408 start_codon:yes stop_codon:yes gene_type:complete